VRGRVLDPAGKPFKGARLYLRYVSSHGFGFHEKGWTRRGKEGDLPLADSVWPLAVRATSGADGTFRFTFGPADLDARLMEEQSALPAVIAVADGHGPSWAALGKPGTRLTLRLTRDDVPVLGRILDEDGQPVRGVKVRVVCLVEQDRRTAPWAGPIPGQPQTVTTGADGQFRLTGLGRERRVILGLQGETIEHRQISATVNARAGDKTLSKHHGHGLPATFTFVAAAGRRIRGVVRDKATGRPVAGVRVKAWDGFVETITDKEGRYELTGTAKAARYTLTARPGPGQPYFSASASSDDAPGLAPLTVNFNLVGGIALRGRVKEKGGGKPAVAVVDYHPLFPNPHVRKIAPYDRPASSAVVGPDGSYSLVVLPGPGVVCLSAAPRDTYALGLVTRKALAALFKDEKRRDDEQSLTIAPDEGSRGWILQERYNAFALINPAEKETALTVDLELLPGRTLAGTLVGPDGKALRGATVSGLKNSLDGPETLEGASFLVKRLSPGRTRKLLFEQRDRGLAARVIVRPDEKGPLTVRLGPSGSVSGRLLSQDRKPVAGVQVLVGPAGTVGGERRVQTDRQGRFRMEGLVPGERYRVVRRVGAVWWWQEFTATAKGNELGDLLPVRTD
jgi:protocatechuate 3,4-dioxygenase beta subunit